MKVIKLHLWTVSFLLVFCLSALPTIDSQDEPVPDRGWLRGGLAWSPDSTQLAIGSSLGVWIYAVDTWEDILFRDDQRYVTSLAWSPSGDQIASASGETIDLWDTATGETLMTLEGHTNTVSVVSWGSDGRLLASGSWDGTVRLREVSSGGTQHVLDIPRGDNGWVRPWSVGWSPDDSRIVVNGLTIWDVATGAMLEAWTEVDETNVARWQPSNGRIAIDTYAGQIEIRDASTSKLMLSLVGHPRFICTLAWSPDGQHLASTGGKNAEDSRRIKVWDASTGRVVVELAKGITTGDATFYEYALAWSPDGRWLASTSDDGTVHLWDTTSWELVRVDNRFYSLVHTDDYISPTLIPTATPNSD